MSLKSHLRKVLHQYDQAYLYCWAIRLNLILKEHWRSSYSLNPILFTGDPVPEYLCVKEAD